MPKPCPHPHDDPDLSCRICFWLHDCSATGYRYRQLWGEPEPKCGPSLLRRAWNFTKAAVGHVLAGAPRAPQDVQDKRLALCLACELYDTQRTICTHVECGCFVRAKVQWADQRCPIGKW